MSKRIQLEAKRAIEIDSTTIRGNEEIAAYFLKLLNRYEVNGELQTVIHSANHISKRQLNLIAKIGDPLVDRTTKRGLLLLTHLDTVSPGLKENWTYLPGGPLCSEVKNDVMYGLGAADAKIDFICKLHAACSFRDRKFKEPLYLVGTCAKEIGMIGARYLIQSMAVNPRCVLVGAPTDLQIIGNNNKFIELKLSIDFSPIERDARGFNRRINIHSFGESALSGYPSFGRSAILQLLNFLEETSKNGFEIRFNKIYGGDFFSKIPDYASSEFYLSSKQFEDFKRFFQRYVYRKSANNSFNIEIGGVGDAGVKFLPVEIQKCFEDIGALMCETVNKGDRGSADRPQENYIIQNESTSWTGIRQRLSGLDLYFDVRLFPQTNIDIWKNEIKEKVHNLGAKYPGLNMMSSFETIHPHVSTKEDSWFLSLCRKEIEKSGVKQKSILSSYGSEAAHFYKAGYDVLSFGPGQAEGASSSPNEGCCIEQIEKAVQFYKGVIEKICF